MICTADHHDTIVILQAIHLVQEVGADVIRNNTVQIFEDQKARRHLSRLAENQTNRILRPPIARQTPHIQRGDRVIPIVERMHHGFDGNRLPIPRRAMENDAPLPRHTELLVPVFRTEEFGHFADDTLLHLRVQDDVFPVRLLNALPELGAVLPVSAVKDEDGVVDGVLPSACRKQQLIIPDWRGPEEVAHGAFVGTIRSIDGVENVLFLLPFVHPLPELHRVVEVSGTAVHSLDRRHVDSVVQIFIRGAVSTYGSCAGMPTCGILEEVALRGWNDGEVE